MYRKMVYMYIKYFTYFYIHIYFVEYSIVGDADDFFFCLGIAMFLHLVFFRSH